MSDQQRREMWWTDRDGKEHHLTSLTYEVEGQRAEITEAIRDRLFTLRDEREAWKTTVRRLGGEV